MNPALETLYAEVSALCDRAWDRGAALTNSDDTARDDNPMWWFMDGQAFAFAAVMTLIEQS